MVGQVGFHAVRELDPTVSWVGGLTLGADPIAYAIAHRSWLEGGALDAFTVRKQAKDYGTGRRIEGGLPNGERVIVIEDTITTGASALQALAALEETGREVLAVLALIDRQEGGSGRIRDRGYPLTSIFTAAQLVETARTAG